jgi:hemerythrin-like domain-containing protein
MKRHPSLIPLSRQHHEGLITARLIQRDAPPYKGLPTDLEGKKQYYLDFYRLHLQPHMQLEDRVLFPFVLVLQAELEPLITELKQEHQHIHMLTGGLRFEGDLPEQLHELGALLETHIRKEERVFFERIQELLSEPELQNLQQQIEQAQPYLNQPPYIT